MISKLKKTCIIILAITLLTCNCVKLMDETPPLEIAMLQCQQTL